MAANKPAYYLLWMSGQGDTHVKVVDLETWDWIFSDDIHAPMPPAVAARYLRHNGDNKDNREEVADFEPTTGSTDNDRALFVPGIFLGDECLDSYVDAVEAADDVARWKKKLKITHFTEEWEGGIY